MADGDPIIQGQPGWGKNTTATPTQVHNSGPADGTALYLFGSSAGKYVGDGLYTVAFTPGSNGVRAYSYHDDGVHGFALGELEASGVRGTSMSGGTAAAGVRGENAGAVGVSGSGGQAGVLGEAVNPGTAGVQGIHRAGITDGIGVYGFARTGVWGEGTVGVVGRSDSGFGVGVEGDATAAGGIGVFGSTGASGGAGVYATASTADSAALQVNGRAVFSNSGRLLVAAGATSATTPPGLVLNPASLVFAMLQDDRPGVLVRAAAADPAAGTVTVHLTQAVPADTAVAWMVVN